MADLISSFQLFSISAFLTYCPMHVCLTIPSLSKVCGGTVAVVQNLSDHLVSSADSVTVLAVQSPDSVAEALPRNERVSVIRIPSTARLGLKNEIRKILGQRLVQKSLDVVHDFGIWQPFNHAVVSACREFKIPLVSSPSGMLAPWALGHKAWKKRLGWWLYQRADLLHAAVLVATADQEIKDIKGRVPGKYVALVPNGVDIPEISAKPHVNTEPKVRNLVFLGRIHPVKGLKNLVEAWNLVRPEGWNCIIAGPDEAGHKQELETLLRPHNLEKQFHFPGLLEDRQKWDLLSNAEIFVLPSFTENFGLVVAESLAAGVPVIATQGAPWEELRTHKCGWWINIGIEPLAAALREATSLKDSERQAMGERGRCLVAKKYSWPQVANELKGVYQWVSGKGSKPACVV